jgi:hypothetical protein
LAITSPTSGGRSVGVVRSRTQTMEFKVLVCAMLMITYMVMMKTALVSNKHEQIAKKTCV